jgi:ABC-type transporter Mla subunit MlaD
MQNLLQPLNLEPERKDKMERALTKIESYNSGAAGASQGASNNGPGQGNVVGNPGKILKKGGLANLDPLPQIDGLSKIL